MTPTRRVLLAVPVALVLGACAGVTGPGDRSASSSTEGPPSDSIVTHAAATGIAPDLVHVTELEGFELAPQSVGVVGDDGMSAVYVRDAGGAGTVLLTTSRAADGSVVPCAELSDSSSEVRCSVERGGAYVVLEGEGVDPATLRAAAEAVRVPRADELGHLFAEVPTSPGPPVERGDLPPHGDGAPLNPVGPGG